MNWRVEGLLFENCNCQLICPAHVSFKQYCTHEHCHGYWGVHVEKGHFRDTDLSDLNVAVLYESGQRMYEGGWKQAIYVDERSSAAQQEALESILTGVQGGPWEVLARFVETRLETRRVKIEFEDLGRTKRIRVERFLESEVIAIRATDDAGEAVLKNLYNQIHGAIQVLARGRSRCHEPGLGFENQGTHGLYSNFIWEGTAR